MPIGRVRTDYAGMSVTAQTATSNTLAKMDKEKPKKPKGDASGAVIGGALAGSAVGEGMGQLNFNKAGQTAPVGGSIHNGIEKGIGTGGMSTSKAPTTTPTPAAGPKPTGISGAGWGAIAGAGLGLMAHYMDE